MGNTMGIDMGNSFPFTSAPFRGHVVERVVCVWAAVEVCKVGVEGPTRHDAIVPGVWIQSQERLQMEGSIRVGGASRSARAESSSAWFAAANFARVVEADSPVAPTISELGQPEACRPIAQRISTSKGALGANDWQVAQAAEIESPRPPQILARTETAPPGPDRGGSEQPGLDGGLQRLVSDSGRATSGTIDSAGFVQSIFAERPLAEKSELEASEAGLSGFVSGAGISASHAHGQWFSLWNDWSSWAFAIECLVDDVGDSSRIHKAWAPGAEWSARANASDTESRNDAPDFGPPASSTTADGPLGKNLQPNPTSRRVGAAASRPRLSSEAFAATEYAVELFQRHGGTPGAKQRADQMARAQALCRRSIYWLPGGDQKGREGKVADLFCETFDRRIVGIGSRRNASGSISTAELMLLRQSCFGVKNQSKQRSRPSRRNPLRSGSLRSPLRSGFLREAIADSLVDRRKDESCVTHVYAHCVTHVCARCPP